MQYVKIIKVCVYVLVYSIAYTVKMAIILETFIRFIYFFNIKIAWVLVIWTARGTNKLILFYLNISIIVFVIIFYKCILLFVQCPKAFFINVKFNQESALRVIWTVTSGKLAAPIICMYRNQLFLFFSYINCHHYRLCTLT